MMYDLDTKVRHLGTHFSLHRKRDEGLYRSVIVPHRLFNFLVGKLPGVAQENGGFTAILALLNSRGILRFIFARYN